MTTTFRPRSPEDLLAAVPVVLGFEPRDSIVMLTFGGSTSFHARLDLPARGDPLDGAVATLLAPCLRHRVEQVVFVLYGEDPVHARRVARRLRGDFTIDGIDVVECLRADGSRWYSADGRRAGVPASGLPYDPAAHSFRAQAVMDGHVTLASREELVASLEPDPPRVGAVAEAVRRAQTQAPLTGEEVGALVHHHADAGTVPDDGDLAALLLAIRVGPVRDAAWVGLTRAAAQSHVALWSDAVRRAPAELVADAAAVLGLASWLAGHGALAWCAVDRCLAAEPRHSLGSLVAHLLGHAIAPTAWETTMRPTLMERDG